MEGALYATDSDGNLKVFNVERNDDDRWLNSNYDNADNVWNGDNRWVFVRRNLLHSLPIISGEFVFQPLLSNCRAFCQPQPGFWI